MDNLFILYRYLARNPSHEGNPYNVAFCTLDSYVDIERELVTYADKIKRTGGLEWSDVEKLSEHILASFESAMIDHHGTPLQAATSFVQKYIRLNDIDTLLDAIQCEKARMEHEQQGG